VLFLPQLRLRASSAGTLEPMFNFDDRNEENPRKLILDEATGAVVWTSARDDDGHDHNKIGAD
jgi:phospholipase C